MHRSNPRQLSLGSDPQWAQVPKSNRDRSRELLIQLLLEVIAAEGHERKESHEREDHC